MATFEQIPDFLYEQSSIYVENSLNLYLSAFFNGLTVSHLLNNMGWSDGDILGLFYVFQYGVSILDDGSLVETPENKGMILHRPHFRIPGVLDNLKEKTMSLPFKNERSKQILLLLFSEIHEEIIINLALSDIPLMYNEGKDEDVTLSGVLSLDERLTTGAESAIDLTGDGETDSPFKIGGKGKRKKKKTKKYKSKKRKRSKTKRK